MKLCDDYRIELIVQHLYTIRFSFFLSKSRKKVAESNGIFFFLLFSYQRLLTRKKKKTIQTVNKQGYNTESGKQEVTFPDCSARHTTPAGGNENTASELVGVSSPACLPACQPASQPAANVRATNEACGLYWHAFIRSLQNLHRVAATFLVYRSRNQVSQTFDRPYLLISEPLPHILTLDSFLLSFLCLSFFVRPRIFLTFNDSFRSISLVQNRRRIDEICLP